MIVYRSSPSGVAPGPGRCTNEMWRVCLEDQETLSLLFEAAEDFARGQVPPVVCRSLMLGTMTALQKRVGCVKGIATGCSFRRLVPKVLARQFSDAVEAACAPLQFALSTRAGTDCVGHAIRVATELNPHLTVLSIDGVGAYDNVYGASMLAKLVEVPGLRGLLPFVKTAYSSASSHVWADEKGVRHTIEQHEGGEQGNPLMPLLFSLGIQNALEEVRQSLEEGECLFAYLDDVYVLCSAKRTRIVHDLLVDTLGERAGIQLHSGKTRTWNFAGERLPDMADLGPDVWNPLGVRILGTPVGHEEFVTSFLEELLAEERKLWDAIPSIPDLQCSWQVLLQCAGPRCHHVLRTVPPRQCAGYARGHDLGMQRTMEALLGRIPGSPAQVQMAQHITTLPMRMGGLGLRSAMRTVPGAYWASWADALHMLQQRLPQLTGLVVHHLSHPIALGCLGELQESASRLDRDGFVFRPSWDMLRRGVRPRPPQIVEPGEWHHGWQYYSSSSSEHQFRETVVLAQSCAADQAHLRSHSGPCASLVLHGSPTAAEFRVKPLLFRTLVLERLRLPLSITEARCVCGVPLDCRGQHRAACPRSGLLRSRALPTERTFARVCREAGATVRLNAKLRDMNIDVPATDERAIEVLAFCLELNHGAQLAVDITVRSAVTACGRARPNAAAVDGAVLEEARQQKEVKYAELCAGDRCRLVVVGIETGGRWSPEALSFVERLAASRARDAPPLLRFSSFLSWRKRWCRMLSVSCSRAFAGTLVSSADDQLEGTDGIVPELADLFSAE